MVNPGVKRIATSATAILAVIVGVLTGLAWRASENATHPPAAAYAWHLRDYPALRPQEVTFRSATGVTLAGRFFSGATRQTIVLLHGYGGTQDEMLPVADALNRAGFSVFTYDQRGCGRSGGVITFGALEQRDLSSAVDYLTARGEVESFGALGFSMGGATTVMTAARDPRIQAVVADSAWSNVYHWLRPSLRGALLHPSAPFSPASLKLVEVRSGIDLGTLRPVDLIGRISPRPLLLIHGTADTIVPPADSRQNFAAAGEPKALWWVSNAAHGQTLRPGHAAYMDRVVAFFLQALPTQHGDREGRPVRG
ncbi:MAG TPA: alpha/beta fold hydrolase [Thermomicrobiaceae bacterium]|nr:alpha/beta fold hydrolase [Thermomicrobiaceae bacterium]